MDIHPDWLSRVEVYIQAIATLHRRGEFEKLKEIDPSGALVSGDCPAIYAALKFMQYVLKQERAEQPQANVSRQEKLRAYHERRKSNGGADSRNDEQNRFAPPLLGQGPEE
jgi:hypothetical protein